ncbi:MAG: DedA family protein [Thermomicrobiales bacterium]
MTPPPERTVANTLMELVSGIVEKLGYVGLALLIALENVFPPIPSEVILPLAGFNIWQGSFNFPMVLLASTIGSVIGALILYGIGRWLGKERLRGLVRSHGSKALLKESDIDKADHWFAKYGGSAVFLCRLLPLVRSLISIPAGIEAMPIAKFLALTAVGSAIWNAILIGAGWALGTQWDKVQFVVGYLQWVVIFAVAVALIWFIWRRLATRGARA